MKVNEIAAEGLKKEFNVVVPAATLQEKADSELKALGARVKIPGFRTGHIPAKVLQQRYGKSVLGEVLEKTVNQTSQQVLRDKKLKPALQPKIEIVKYEEGSDLEYKMAVEVLPEIPELDFAKVELERLAFDVDESEVTESLKRLSSRNRKLNTKAKTAKAELGDIVKIDFVGRKDGVEFPGGAAQNFQLELGSGQFIPGFEDQLVGSKAGDEKVVKVSFPDQYHKEDLAGQPVEFTVNVHEVAAVEVPAPDDELAKSMGFADLAGLEKAVREQLGNDYNGIVRTRLKKELFDYLEENLNFPLPEGMVDLEFGAIWEKLLEAKKQGDKSLDKPEAELKEEYQKIARRRVKLGLFLADIGRKEGLQIGRDEISQAIMEQARQYPGQEMKVIEFYRNHPEHVEELRGPIIEDKAVDFILSKVTLNDRKVTLDELTGPESEDAPKKKAAKKTTAKKKKDEE